MKILNVEKGVDDMINISDEQRAHDVAMVLFKKYVEPQELKCDIENIDAHVRSYRTFYDYALKIVRD